MGWLKRARDVRRAVQSGKMSVVTGIGSRAEMFYAMTFWEVPDVCRHTNWHVREIILRAAGHRTGEGT